jgi:hypothetical protein
MANFAHSEQIREEGESHSADKAHLGVARINIVIILSSLQWSARW